MRAQDGGTAYRNARRRRHPRMTQRRTKLPAARTAADKKRPAAQTPAAPMQFFCDIQLPNPEREGRPAVRPPFPDFYHIHFLKETAAPVSQSRGENPPTTAHIRRAGRCVRPILRQPLRRHALRAERICGGEQAHPLRTEDRHAPLSPHDTVSVVFPLLPDVFGKQ